MYNSVPMNKYGTCLEQLMRKFDPLKQLWDLLEVGFSHFVHGDKPPNPLTSTALTQDVM